MRCCSACKTCKQTIHLLLAAERLITETSINANAYRQCFWCVTYLLHDRALLEEIKQEIQPAWQSNAVDTAYLLEKCPLLASFYEEMLRLNNEYRNTPLKIHQA